MDKTVVIKSNRHGIVLNLDDKVSFDSLCDKLKEKFSESSKFFGNVKMALTIDGRSLSGAEIDTVIDIISETTEIDILAVIDNSEQNSKLYQNELNKILDELNNSAAEVYPFDVKDEMVLEFKRSVIILGNVDKKAEVHTDGSVFVLGNLEGSVYAGEFGNTAAKVFANYMRPKAVCIADIPYKLPKADTEKKSFFFKKKKETVTEFNNSVLLSLSDDRVVSEIILATE